MPRVPRLPVVILVVAAAALNGCGVLLGGTVTEEEDRLVARRPGLVEPAGSRYVAAAAGTFDPQALRVAARVTVSRIDHCRVYTESVFERTRVTRRANSAPGIALDAVVLAAGVGAGLLMPSTEGKIGLTVAGAVPLAVDGGATLVAEYEAPVTVTTRTPEAPAGADDSGAYACAVTADLSQPLRLGDQVIAAAQGGYRVELTEDDFLANAVTTGVGFTLQRGGEALAVFVPLGAAYADFVTARATVRRFPTPLRLAQFTLAYPRSVEASRARRIFEDMLPTYRDAAEMQAVAGLAGLEPELRRAAQGRFAELRLDGFEHSIPEAVREALRAERDANTFLLNGLADEGRARLKVKESALAVMCRDWEEYRLRAAPARVEAFRAGLERDLAGDARAAAAWLLACERPAR